MSKEWLEAEQTTVRKAFEKMKLPSVDEEVWRYSNIEQLDIEAYNFISNGSAAAGIAQENLVQIQKDYGNLSALLVSQCGHIVDIWCPEEFLNTGAFVGRLADLEQVDSSAYKRICDKGIKKMDDYFAVMNGAYLKDYIVVFIPAGASILNPIGILELADLDGAKSFPRLLIDVGQNAVAKVLHIYRSGEVSHFTAPVTEIVLEQSSNLSYLSIEDLGLTTHQISSVTSSVAAQANLSLNTVSLGAASARLRTDCRLEGRGSSGEMLSLYFATGDQQFDFRTFQKHSKSDTQSNLLFKGAVDEKARLIYSGMVRIDPEAKSSNAFQANHNLKLSEDAWVDSVPNLEIENNDVSCSHATTVGPINEDQRFYLESRGISGELAEKLIVAGFFKEALLRLPFEDARDTIFKQLTSRFDTSSHLLKKVAEVPVEKE